MNTPPRPPPVLWDDITLDANATATWGATTITMIDSGGAGSGWTCAVTTSRGNGLITVTAATNVVVSPRMEIHRS